MPYKWMTLALYQAFKHEYVTVWKEDEFQVTIDITDFLIGHRGLYELAKERHEFRFKK